MNWPASTVPASGTRVFREGTYPRETLGWRETLG
jgi:hypothetical protein